MSDEWYWEGNVVKTVCKYLQQEDYEIQQVANTETRERGVDIKAKKGEETLIVEVKGYPSMFYQRGKQKGLPKPTKPNTQAKNYFSGILLSAILQHAQNPTATIAIALPDFPVYLSLLDKTSFALKKLGITVFIVSKSGSIEIFKQNRR